MTFLGGLLGAVILGELWNSQKNPPKVYVNRKRFHHYQAGGLLFLLGAALRNPTLAGAGAGLFLHDIDDVPS
jgi:hypothetical protein